MSDSPVASGCHAYPLELQKRHLLTRIDCRRWLIDTGSPTTFGHAPALCLGGRTYDVTPTGFTGLVDPHYLAEQTGCTVDGLMGSRLMSDFDILFDIPGRTIAFSEALLAVKGAESTMGTCGTLTARVNGHEATLIFDTGADISYVDPAWVAGVDPVGEATDFYPFLGSFTMPTYRVGVDLQGHGMDVLAGILPDRLRRLNPPGTGILGNEAMWKAPVLWSPRQKKMVFSRWCGYADRISCLTARRALA